MKTQNKFREWLADKILGLYFWLAEMTEQEYWDRANSFRPTQDAQDGACALCGGEVVDPIPAFCKQCRVQDPPRL